MNEHARPVSEDAILKLIASHFHNSHPRVLLSRGDDCAILKAGNNICVSSDLFLEDVHFRLSYFTPQEIGKKSLAVNISDLAGFGARPVAFNLCLGLPKWADMAWLDNFFTGMADMADKYRMVLMGGDLSRSDKLHISITVFGEKLDGCGFLGRGGSIPGDTLFVIGPLGLARIGLCELEKKGRQAMREWPHSCAAHLCPMPQIAAGLMLARAGYNARPPALMDLSDGILRDLPRLLGLSGELGSCANNIGADIRLAENMLAPEVLKHAKQNDQVPVLEALAGGEDYALLGACAPDMVSALQAAIPGFLTIGNVTDAGKISCNGMDIGGLTGFDHFLEKSQ